ncbi:MULTISPECIES: amidohydrolase family protein [Nonomuraea]|uniref:Amidohydrolase family protein n=1 Tax=Nonomuraea mangrovi TaxID=2316207 RepID=A0ABW4T256_9ACTN
MRIDAHHHLWDPRDRVYPWMAGLDPLRRPYGIDDLRSATSAADVNRTVLVQTVSSLEETQEFLAVAADSGGLIAGVVGWVDLADPAIGDSLAGLTGPLVGIRHQVQDEPDREWLARPAVMRGLDHLGTAGLAYDLLVRHDQLPVARSVAQRLPEVRFVLDHAGGPPIAAGDLEPWAGEIRALAALPNVSCKLSGLVTVASWTSWSSTGIAPYASHVFDCFGPERVMFGSDWPVCELAASYGEVVALAETLTAELSTSERDAVFAGTARHVYALPKPEVDE